MTRYVALLRSINVGGHTVKMDDLRRMFEALEFANVETFIASGNVIFDAAGSKPAALAARIERHLASELGYEVPTFLRSVPEIVSVAEYEPFDASDVSHPGFVVYVGFVAAPIDGEASRRVAALRSDYDDFHTNGRELYWLCRGRSSDSKVTGAILERALGRVPTTLRNTTTVRRLAAKYGGGQAPGKRKA